MLPSTTIFLPKLNQNFISSLVYTDFFCQKSCYLSRSPAPSLKLRTVPYSYIPSVTWPASFQHDLSCSPTSLRSVSICFFESLKSFFAQTVLIKTEVLNSLTPSIPTPGTWGCLSYNILHLWWKITCSGVIILVVTEF